MTTPVDAVAINTRMQFSSGLGRLRAASGRTVREVADEIGLPSSTVGGYFGGKHLPARNPPDTLRRLLRACGVTDERTLAEWEEALRRVRDGRNAAGPVSDSVGAADVPEPPQVPRQRTGPPSGPAGAGWLRRTALVSTRPPVDRLTVEPELRGRDDLVAGLVSDLRAGDTTGPRPAYVLHGLGGCGKTTIALAVARQAMACGIRTWWVFAGGTESVWAGMLALAAELGASTEQLSLGSSPDLLWRLLDEQDEPWLLIIDNVDDPRGGLALPDSELTDGTGWLRPINGRYGMVLLTTRDGRDVTWGDPPPPWLRLLPVGPLSDADGAALLTGLAGPVAGSREDAEHLADQLGGLPLALRLTGQYLAQAGRLPPAIAGPGPVRTYRAFAEALADGRHDELFINSSEAAGPADRRARDLIGRAWEPSLELLGRQRVAHTRTMLRLLACFEPGRIPHGLVLESKVLAGSALFAGTDRYQVWEALRALTGFGLVEIARTESADPTLATTIAIHPLVRETSRQQPDLHADVHRYLALLTRLLNEVTGPLDPRDLSTWERWQALAEHCQSPLSLVEEHRIGSHDVPPDLLTPAIQATRFLRATGQLHRAEAAQQRLLRIGKRVFDPDHPQMLGVAHEHGRIQYGLGRLDTALRELRTVLAARQRVLGPDDPDTLTTQHYLARVLRDQGDLGRSERLLSHTLERRRVVLGEEHPDTLTTRNVAADLLRARGRADLAGPELDAVLTAQGRVLGLDHPAALVTRYHQALLWRDCGDLPAAADGLAGLVDISRRVLGAEHPRTLTALQALIDVRYELGALAEAETAVRSLLDVRRRTLGDDHPATFATRHRLGQILARRGNFEAADQELSAALDGRRRVLGPRHRDTAASRADLDALRLRPAR
ncbi:helix-turn-helix domain-containing protein [Micromonospora sp. B006]|uniref:helix-turn-helix domain-containing protein n=1 Tax=Micromonospora sp. B006 TaxID=2201999 RepID=UPI000E3046EF|nr:helix-turn-helix domain-containing protein [Micromonospora sp. B006]AXO37859.1 putative ATP/GTP-binding protein [Micromonospora sp. B006]